MILRVERKGEATTGGLESQGPSAEAVKGGKPMPLGEEIAPAKGTEFVERLFSNLLSQVRGSLATLQTRVDEAAAAMVAKPNQVTLEVYKESVSHLLAFVIDQSVKVGRTVSLKRTKDGSPKEFVRVEIINEKMAALTRDLLSVQKPLLDLVSRLDEIRGLLLDLYDWKPLK